MFLGPDLCIYPWMRMRVYKLVGRTAVEIVGAARDGLNSGYAERAAAVEVTGEDPWRVGFTEVAGGRTVSTVFLGLDHGWGEGPPLVFETMVFNDGFPQVSGTMIVVGGGAELIGRCSTWEEAEALHEQTVAGLRRLRVVK